MTQTIVTWKHSHLFPKNLEYIDSSACCTSISNCTLQVASETFSIWWQQAGLDRAISSDYLCHFVTVLHQWPVASPSWPTWHFYILNVTAHANVNGLVKVKKFSSWQFDTLQNKNLKKQIRIKTFLWLDDVTTFLIVPKIDVLMISFYLFN